MKNIKWAFCRRCNGPASLLEQEQGCPTSAHKLGAEDDPSTHSSLTDGVQSHRAWTWASTGCWWQGPLAVQGTAMNQVRGLSRECKWGAAGDKAGGRAGDKLELAGGVHPGDKVPTVCVWGLSTRGRTRDRRTCSGKDWRPKPLPKQSSWIHGQKIQIGVSWGWSWPLSALRALTASIY